MYKFIYQALCAVSLLIASLTPYGLYASVDSESFEIEHSSITCEITDDADESESEELRILRMQLEILRAQMANGKQRPSFNVHATCWTANTHFAAQMLAKFSGNMAANIIWSLLHHKKIWQYDNTFTDSLIWYAYRAIGYVCTMMEWSATVDSIRAGIETEPSLNTQGIVETTIKRAVRLAAATCASSFMTASLENLFF